MCEGVHSLQDVFDVLVHFETFVAPDFYKLTQKEKKISYTKREAEIVRIFVQENHCDEVDVCESLSNTMACLMELINFFFSLEVSNIYKEKCFLLIVENMHLLIVK